MTQDIRSRRIVVLAHCVLNQNSRVAGLAGRPAIVEEIIEVSTRNDVGIVQLSCPEFIAEGLARKSQTKEQYDTPRFRRLCRQIALSTAKVIQEYVHSGVKVLAILGIEGSPTCAAEEPYGILIEELKKELVKRKISIPFHELNLKAPKADVDWLNQLTQP